MIKFLSLGSGSSGNCYLLRTENTGILIDAGLSVKTLRKRLKDYGLSLDEVDAVFVTHDHADHIKSVGHLANDHDKPIYATELVHMGINRSYCVTSKLTSQHVHIVQKNVVTQVGDFHVTPFHVPHDSSDNVGYRVVADGIVFCLITDIGHVTQEVREQVGQANYLVLEANHDEDMLLNGPYPAYLKGRIRGGNGHLNNRLAAELVSEYATPELRHLWLCHLSEENNHPELARKTVETVLREHGLIAGVDFKMDVLKRRVPSEYYELTLD